MDAWIGTAGLITIVAIMPGPNNLIVMREAARTGWAGALRAILGIVAGGLVLLFAVGAGAVFPTERRVAAIVSIVGCIVLLGLGARLVASSFKPSTPQTPAQGASTPIGSWALFALQFLNPKAWVLVLTATSLAHPASGGAAPLAHLALLFVVIPTLCLVLWSCLGLLIQKSLGRRTVRAWFDRTMGALLVGFAFLLLLEGMKGA